MPQKKINIIKYLDRTGDLQKIEECAKIYTNECIFVCQTNNYHPPLRISLGLDYIWLVEVAGEFAQILVKEPYIAKKELTDLICTSCAVLTEHEAIKVHLLLRLNSFPEILIASLGKNNLPGGLFTKSGILTELSPVTKYMQDVSFTCKYSTCNNKGNIFKKGGKCSLCGKELVEIECSRLTGEKVVGLLLDPIFLTPGDDYKRTQGITVEFRDELLLGLEIGMSYNIALTFERGIFLSWGVQPKLPDPLVRILSSIDLPPLPSAISQLILNVRKASDSPWAIVTSLSTVIPGGSFPKSAFLHLKTALLLSLGSIYSKSPIPIIALGDCGTLMMETWHCSSRAMLAPTGPASLLIASYGVCLVLENNPSLSFITTAVESELVTIKHYKSPKDKSHSTYTLKSAIWMYWDCNKNSAQEMHKLKTLIEIFGIPFLDCIDVNDEEISMHILQNAIDDVTPDAISQKDFRKFIDAVSGIKITMSELASNLIRNYFVASRRERPECLPLKAIKVLTSLSESHARLSMRDTVTYEDAVAAIFLYEESIEVLFGPSVSSSLPKRTVTTNNTIEIAQQMDATLGKFSCWLQSYTKFYSSTTSENCDNSFNSSNFSIPQFTI